MKILYIDVNCQNSSTGKIVYDLYCQGRADGHETAVCYGRGPLVEGEKIFKFGLDWETRLHALLTRVTGLTGCWSCLSTRRLLRFLREFKPDVVHIHELHAYFVNLKPLLHYLAEQHIPVVQTLHCEFTYTGKCGYAYECGRWKEGCGRCPHLRDYPKTLVLDWTARMFREKQALFSRLDKLVITAPSGWLADRARQSFLAGRDIRVVHNSIDTIGVFHPWPCDRLREKHKLKEGEKVVLAVAPDLMSARKGGRWMLRLAESMKREKIRFILIGVDNLSEKFPENVIALGRTSNQKELAEYYSLADCFVICSDKETFSMTCAESLCCGTPVAGFRCGAPETVFMPPTAVFCEFGDLSSLQSNIKLQLDSSFSSDTWRTLRSQFSRQKISAAYQQIYQDLTTGAHL